MTGFEIEQIEPVTLTCHNRLTNMYKLSPFVWSTETGGYEIMLRAVPRRDDEPRLKIAEVWHGRSEDGLHFDMDIAPALFPGPDAADLDGCEDPTVLVDQGRVHAWYTGWNQAEMTGRLLYAAGENALRLEKRGVALDSVAPHSNPKEATIVRRAGDGWQMFFEFARDGHSRIGIATADNLAGPWTISGEPFERRAGHFDDWHLSTGPMAQAGLGNPVMFYNGANEGAHWGIGWVTFDAAFRTVVSRCAEPLIVPSDLEDDARNIAFAASVVEQEDRIWLYYSISDQSLHRATLAVSGSTG